MTTDLRFPIGRFEAKATYSRREIAAAIGVLAQAPVALRAAVNGLDAKQLATPYRPGGWRVGQVVHHIADSQVHGYIRLKTALTEETPTIRTYPQDAWAQLPDADTGIAVSLDLFEALQLRWTRLLRALDDTAMTRRFVHPDDGVLTVADGIALYAWHVQHHIAHITALRSRRGW